MRNKAFLSVITFLALSACTASPTVNDPDRLGDIELVADQGVLPPGTNGLAVVANSDVETERIWKYFGFKGPAPEVETAGKVALFVGTGESGSCPIKLEGVDVGDDEIRFETSGQGGTCTTDFRFRSFVFLFPAGEPPSVGDKVNLGGRFRVESSESIVEADEPEHLAIGGPCSGDSEESIANRVKKVRMEVRPCPGTSGATPRFVLINTGMGRLGYGPGFKLEWRAPGGWEWINRNQGFDSPLFYLAAGKTSEPEAIEVYFDEPEPVQLESGTYRVSKTLQLTPGKMRPPTMTVRAVFELRS